MSPSTLVINIGGYPGAGANKIGTSIGRYCQNGLCESKFKGPSIRAKAVDTKYTVTLPDFDFESDMLFIEAKGSNQVIFFIFLELSRIS